MNRKELKSKAKKVFKRNYLKTILVVFIIGLLLKGSYGISTINSQTATNNHQQKNNYQLVNEVATKISKKSSSGKSSGVIAPFFNKVTEKDSAVIGFLNALNLFLLKEKVNAVILSIIGVVIIILLKIFIQSVFEIGENRYFLEQRRYNTSVKKILFPFTVHKNIHLALIILIRDIYLMLWNLTIVGGIIKYYEYMMIPYILAENPNISRKEAFRLSKEIMNGRKFEAFKLDVSFIGWEILGMLTFGILDVFFVKGYKKCTFAEYYMQIRSDKKDQLSDSKLLNDKYLDIEVVSDNEYPMDKFSIKINKKIKKDKRNYDVNYSIKNYILMFFTFAFVGWAWEVLIHIVEDGRFVNRGTMFGPWLPIYGFGALMILIILKPLRKNQLVFFIGAMVLAGILEYSTSWYLETFKHTKWWDYSGYFFNINGRICLEGLLVFGLGGCSVTYFIGPVLNELYSKIKPRVSLVICAVLLLLFGIDTAYSSAHPNKGKGITDYDQKVK